MDAAGGLTPGLQAVLDAAGFAGAQVLVALGGGADSAVLAWAVREMGCPVRAVTVDHGLPASPALIGAAQAVAAHLGIGHRVVPAPAAGASEAALRAARYRALEAEARPDEVIATGHTADDQAETVLGNLLRGAGAGGLSGIPERRGRWARPLLAVSREEVRAAADRLGLPYVDDPGNADLTRRRNVLRHEVLPLLAARIGPGVRAAITRAAALMAADDAALEARAAAVPLRRAGGAVRLPAAALATLPPPIAARAARRALRLLLDPYPGHGQDVEAILLAASAAGPAARPLQGGYLAVREGPWVVLRPAAARLRPRADPAAGARTSPVRGVGGASRGPSAGSRPPARGAAGGPGGPAGCRGGPGRAGRPARRPGRGRAGAQGRGRGPPGSRHPRVAAAGLAGGRRGWHNRLGARGSPRRLGGGPRRLCGAPEARGGMVRIGRVLISAEQIERRLAEMGAEITADYRGQDLLLVAVLKGAFMVMADLSRHIALPVDLDFMAVSSYGEATRTSGVVRILKDLDREISGRHVLIVEDIVDSGLTLHYLRRNLEVRRPASLEIATLLLKPGLQKLPVSVRYVGFEIPPDFVIGYGLDYFGRYRNLPYVAVMEEGEEEGEAAPPGA